MDGQSYVILGRTNIFNSIWLENVLSTEFSSKLEKKNQRNLVEMEINQG